MSDLHEEPTRFRSTTTKSAPSKVEREGGKFGFGLIKGASIITRGEALGHELWIDSLFLQATASAINQSPTGLKVRFTHPGLSSDAVGTKLGKAFNAKVVGDQVLADVHFQEAATKTPDGDLADYVMTLAAETPEDFGLSIVFAHDSEASDEHSAENTSTSPSGSSLFISPDENNSDNYPHAFLAELYACDVVDSPAANPAGLFKRGQDYAVEASHLLEYALGLSGAKPTLSALNVDGDRAKQFVSRFLSHHGLTISKEGDHVADNDKGGEVLPTREQFTGELQSYITAFGAVKGAEWFSKSISFADAQGLLIVDLKEALKASEAKVTELEAKVEALGAELGEKDGPEFNPGDKAPEKSLKGKIRISGKSYSK